MFTNLDRDMFWADIDIPLLTTIPTSSSWNSLRVQNDGVQYQKHGYCRQWNNHAGAGTGQAAYGVRMRFYDAETNVFRVRGAVQDGDRLYFGFVSSGTTEAVIGDSHIIFYNGPAVDELIAIRQPSTWNGEDIVFFQAVPDNGGFKYTALSVQNLIAKPDPYSSQVR